MNKSSRIYVAGHRGLVGSAILKNLKANGYKNLLYRTKKQLDLQDYRKVDRFFQKERPQYVLIAAARVGGILANHNYRADFLWDNLNIQNNLLKSSQVHQVKKLLFLGSSCIYPTHSPQPIKESYLLNGELEYTNEPYAIAKIAGLKLCESFNMQYGTNFLALMPTSIYGPGDRFDLERSHVIPALILKCVLGKLMGENNISSMLQLIGHKNSRSLNRYLQKHGISSEYIKIWGTGKPRREFLHSDDLAAACLHIMKNVTFDQLKGRKKQVKNTHINVGYGQDISIKELAHLIQGIVGFKGKFKFDSKFPDGTSRKLLNSDRIRKLGWKPTIDLQEGIRSVVAHKFPFVLKEGN